LELYQTRPKLASLKVQRWSWSSVQSLGTKTAILLELCMLIMFAVKHQLLPEMRKSNSKWATWILFLNKIGIKESGDYKTRPTRRQQVVFSFCQKRWYRGPRAILQFFYIYFIMILQKYMVRHKFCKNIYLPPWLTASGT
jgi:hypothetical protein